MERVDCLFPAILNLASNAHISTNATCGEQGPEMFCKLVEHVPGRPVRNPQCRICDGSSGNPKERHPISNAIDGTNNWWQSPSIQNGREYHWVTITLDLRQVFQVAYVIIKAANAPRPGNWILERSVDGTKFSPWQYYAVSDTECLTRYNITPRRGPPTYRADDEVICTSYYSRLVPLEHGEIHTSLINGRPSADDLSPELLEFTSAQYIRLRLQRIRTLNADLMTLSRRDPKDLDPIVTRRYYYSIKDISVGGMCICYGHASSCPWDETKLQCQCEHNTCGESCSTCCPGYHQQPWRPGTVSSGNTCEECNCHNKAKDCYYDESVANQKRSLNTAGQFKGGGVCINCLQNTMGINCETCIDGYYRPHKVSPYEDDPCHPCDCDPLGSLSSVCIKDDLHSDLHKGQCPCKEGYTGEKCDRCQFGYKGYPACVLCDCSPAGSVNEDPCSEPCLCKENVEGKNCDGCKPGFYNLKKGNPQGCSECFCFGVSDVCDSLSWPISQVGAPSASQGLITVPLPMSSPVALTAFGGFLKYTVSYDVPVETVDNVWGKKGKEVSLLLENQAVYVSRARAGSLFVHHRELPSPLGSPVLLLQSCLPGYYRVDGILFGGICQPCECHGHAAQCDVHGVCSACKHNTTGDHCEQCMPGFYGRASRGTPGDCQPCACPLSTASNNFSPTCHLDDGDKVVCDQCAPGYSGAWCERCADGYYGNPTVPGESCVPCNCSGNVDPLEVGHCDSVTGECLRCTGNTDGAHCERCAAGYYGDAVTAKNCRACECHGQGSLSGVCHLETGLCDCKPHVTGQQCDQCLRGYYGLDTGLGCSPCNCSASGSTSDDCTEEGQCRCVPGVAGERCDRCARGFYAYQDGSCTRCDCAHTQNTCDPASGECVCPPHTRGVTCEECGDGYWGHDPELGCQPCNCSHVGSASRQCDALTGHCQCKPAFSGPSCGQCSLGYRDFPDCVACDCDLRGTLADTCDGEQGLCSCAEDTGTCSCKENVVGLHCSECRAGTYALRADDALGCAPCFCFGLSQLCSEAEGYVRTPVTLRPHQPLLRVVSQSDLRGTTQGVYYQAPDILLDAATVRQHVPAEPLYWRLPGQFQGDQLVAYGGKLKYSVAFYSSNGVGTFNLEPQVLIKGGRTRKQVIYVDAPAPENGVRQEQEVGMKENFWKYFNSVSEKPVTRSDFMSVLSNIEYILIKASYGQGLQQSRISNVSMEVGREAEGLRPGWVAAALIEKCLCPPGTAGLSCQDCAPGYHRGKLPEGCGGGPRPLLAPCVPCTCNNHSDACDPDTGTCLNCSDNTAGDHCDVCAPGYYGKVTGSASDCTLCACPHSRPASFSPTCVLEGDHDFRCDACLLGYEGQYCERCSSGYHGNPRAPGGTCQSCDCSPRGSVHSDCDRRSGQCVCRPGATGLRCEECEPRHILVESDCISCDDVCVGVLLSDLDNIGDNVLSVNLTSIIPAPYGILSNLENTTKYLQVGTGNSEVDRNTCHRETELTGSRSHCWCPAQVISRRNSDGDVKVSSTIISDVSFVVGLLTCEPSVFIRAAEDLLSQIQRNYQKPQEELKVLREAASGLLSKHDSELQAATGLVREAEAKTRESSHLLRIVKANLREVSVSPNSSLLRRCTHFTHASYPLLTRCTYVHDINFSLQQLERHRDELLLWTAKIRRHVDDLVMQMSKRRALDLVYRAEDHAAELQRLAGALDSGLGNVKRVSLNATSATHVHSSVQSRIEASEKLAQGALRTGTEAGLVRDAPWASVRTLLCEAVRDCSIKVLEQRLSGLNLCSKRGALGKCMSLVRFSYIYPNVRDVITRIFCFMQRISNEQLISRVLPHPNPCQLSCHLVLALLAGRKVKDVETQANLLFDRLKPLKTLEENLSRNLSEIKLLISQARKQAASIKVAVSADRDCIRAYQPQISSTNYNTLTLNVKTSEPDNLLFYLGSSTSSDFLAVEMRRGKVAFLWDMGSGSARLEFPDFPIDDDKWHSISVTRFGNVGSLSVREMSATQKPPARTRKSPGTANVLEINNSTLMFVGGLGGHIKKSPAVKVTHFKGCMGEAFLNGQSVGLWNYIEREGTCHGCFGSPQSDDSSFHFDGSGYSVVEKTLRATVTQIIMLFSTFSPNGLLLYLASNGTKDFLSIELVHGRIKVTVDLGSGPLALVTDRRYNNGTWYKIAFQRNRKQGLLAVIDAYNTSSKETKQGETPGASSDLNRLDKDPVYVGGLPRSRVVRKGVTSKSYVGCIKNLEISRSTFDLLRNSYGVRKGCVLEPIRSVSFLKGGYVELPPKSLSPESELLATFATKNSSGIILAALGKQGQKQGPRQAHGVSEQLRLHVNAGDGTSLRRALVRAPTGTYGDGREHSISLIRSGRILSVQLDETTPVEMKLGPSAESRTINVSKLYVGGTPRGEGPAALRMRGSFHGCIRNLVFNCSDTIASEMFCSWKKLVCVSGGPSCAWLRVCVRLLQERCAPDQAPEYVPNAHQFGLTQGSHFVLAFNESSVRKRLSVQLSLRTFASSGLIYYMAHQNHVDYATLQLLGGRLHFLFDLGKGRTKVSHPALLNDGKWHTVKTEYLKRKGFVTVDGQDSPMVPMVGDGTALDVEGKLYLGGLPSDYRPRDTGHITHSIPACIGEVTVNSKQLDKDSPVSAFAVTRCYAVAQEGTFFEGSGYAAFAKEGYRVGSDVNITLEFRTSSENGVLLGISSAKVDAIGLEIVNGKILFHVNNGAGRVTATYEPKATSAVCDGKWHTLQANKSKHRVVLIVDGNAVRAESPHPQSTSADTNNPIYVGGYPADVRQNCLSSQTSFRGCLRKLALLHGPQVQSCDFSRAFDLQGVFPHSCPGAEP
uniref:Laminin subunit alpha-1 n=1 Tax=Equus asinus asinus TaxID=83772 RepID=A0A8C4MR81_EQUAS